MKWSGLVAICLIGFLVNCLADPRKKIGGSLGRRTSSKQPSSNSGNYGHSDLASLSYSGYSAPKKAPEPARTNQQPGWSVPKKDTATPVQQPSYPSSGGLSGNSAAKPASTGSNAQHSYPASNGNSGANAQHAYPASSGNSGSNSQHAYPASTGLSGSGTGTGQHVQASNVNPAQSNPTYNNPYNKPQGNAQPPPYSAGAPPAYNPAGHPGAPNYGGAPPPYSAGHAAPNYGGAPQYGGAGYGGHPPAYGGYGGGYGGGQPNYGGYGGYGGGGGYGGYGGIGGGSFGGFGGLGNQGYQRKSGFLSGNKFGAILAGLAVWNLVRSGSRTTNNNVYNYYGSNATSNDPHALPPDPIVEQLSNCTLTITSDGKTEVTLLPCVIVSSFALNAESANPNRTPDANGLNCMITLIFKNATEKMVNMPCADLSKMAPADNATNNNNNNNQTNCDPAVGNCPPAMALYDAPPLSVIPLSVPSTTTVNSIVETSSTTITAEAATSTTTVPSTSTTAESTTESTTSSSTTESATKPSE